MSTKTAILTVRTDEKTKKSAQKAAKGLGVPLSMVINASLRKFILNPRLELEPLTPNAKTEKVLRAAMNEKGERKVYTSMEEFLSDLKK